MFNISRNDLAEFLMKARQNTYAGGKEGQNLIRGGKQFIYDCGNFLYYDTYYGFDPFVGQELVWSHDGGFLWAMNYYGGLVVPDRGWATNNAVKVYDFLKSALLLISAKSPYRGPTRYTDTSGEWAYENVLDPGSNIGRFSGQEYIYFEGILVYKCDYHGGIVKGR